MVGDRNGSGGSSRRFAPSLPNWGGMGLGLAGIGTKIVPAMGGGAGVDFKLYHPIPVRPAYLLLKSYLYTYIINNFILQNINLWYDTGKNRVWLPMQVVGLG